MSNPFMAALGGTRNDGGFGKMVQAFQQFRASFRGDPKAEVEKLLQSGQMSQQQLNQLQALAQQFQGLIQ